MHQLQYFIIYWGQFEKCGISSIKYGISHLSLIKFYNFRGEKFKNCILLFWNNIFLISQWEFTNTQTQLLAYQRVKLWKKMAQMQSSQGSSDSICLGIYAKDGLMLFKLLCEG